MVVGVTAADAILLLLWAGLTAYALFGGADFGAGFWDLLGGGRRSDAIRTLIEDTIGPVWEDCQWPHRSPHPWP